MILSSRMGKKTKRKETESVLFDRVTESVGNKKGARALATFKKNIDKTTKLKSISTKRAFK